MIHRMITTALILSTLPLVVWASVSPDGGNDGRWYGSGVTMNISWNDDLEASMVDVALWNADQRTTTTLAQRLPAVQGTFQWTIPPGLPAGDRYRIMIRDADHAGRFEMSGGWLRINMPQPVVSSVEDVDADRYMHVAPMPAVDNVTITWNDAGTTHVDIVDVHHRVVDNVKVDHTARWVSIDTSTLASGMYFARMLSGEEVLAVRPLVISR